ncbi:serine-tRNA ligase-like protein [Dinothrombium tinctorium]|uniref:Serine-tRNA ligase-like protein n=1 Tax=Dinothrombium tinctorium TaxID=1965070 RepID=A0A3S3SP26_9ACAR|nr:serine-tRNA ligase-like protein [Dinothrombium tinctorium]RWS17593.1 serine-tRNA ligase-like protein [Dinothrombium tinctorium]RWS17605.1 serine-tRNA ligase-like protein [Dinothrombium tinctorium]
MKPVITPNIDSILADLCDEQYSISVKRRMNASEERKRIVSDIGNEQRIDATLIESLLPEIKKLIELRSKRAILRDKLKTANQKKEEERKQTAEDKAIEDEICGYTQQYRLVTDLMWAIEDKIMPLILRLPNAISVDVPVDGSRVVRCVSPKTENRFKLLDYRKLAYINQTMFSSIIGPNSNYLHDEGAEIHQALINHFAKLLRKERFLDFSGLDFVKTAIVEACNDISIRNYKQDSLMIKEGFKVKSQQKLHLVGDAALESKLAFLIKYHSSNKLPVRLFSIGAEYDQSLKQVNTIHCLSAVENNAEKSEIEMKLILDTLWEGYVNLKLPCRMVNCQHLLLHDHEYLRYIIELNFPSTNTWKIVARISHYGHYLSNRLGLEKVHLIDASAIDTTVVLASIMENNQLDDGKFKIPECIQSERTN